MQSLRHLFTEAIPKYRARAIERGIDPDAACADLRPKASSAEIDAIVSPNSVRIY